jgi:hypothetical protein
VPHLAGTEGDKTTAAYVADYWKNIGVDSVYINDYDVLLDYPDEKLFNRHVLSFYLFHLINLFKKKKRKKRILINKFGYFK